MWPILVVSITALAVVLERIFWWLGRWMRRDPKRIEKVFTAIEVGDVAEASRLSRDSRDPVLRMMWNGLNHQHASLQGALQVAAGIEIKRAGRFLVVMDTLVTLAPLLGLLGTITGLMKSFSFLGNEELAVQAVTGGIAEALIATACGLGIAIFALIPFNFFTSRVSNLEFELQTAATNLEVMLEAQSKGGAHWKCRFRVRRLHRRRAPRSKSSHECPIAHPEEKRADRDHPVDRHHVLSPRQLHDGEPEPDHMKGMKVALPVGASGQDPVEERLRQLSVDKDGYYYFDKNQDRARGNFTEIATSLPDQPGGKDLYPRRPGSCPRKRDSPARPNSLLWVQQDRVRDQEPGDRRGAGRREIEI